METNNKLKTFWERPEGTAGLLTLSGITIAGIGILNYFSEPILNALKTAVGLGAFVAVGGTVAYVVSDKNFRTSVSALFQATMKKFTGFVIEMDPIAILKTYLKEMRIRIQKIEDNIEALVGQRTHLKMEIAKYKKSAEQNLRLADAAQKQNNQNAARVNVSKANREHEFVQKLTSTYDSVDFLIETLSKMKSSIDFLYQDTESEVQIREEEYKIIQSAHKAMRSAKSVINGSSEKELFEQAMEYTAIDIANKLGEIDRFMDESKSFTDNVDIQNAVCNEKGMELLNKWRNNDDIFSYKPGQLKVRVATDGSLTNEQVASQQEYEAAQNAPAKKSLSNLFQ